MAHSAGNLQAVEWEDDADYLLGGELSAVRSGQDEIVIRALNPDNAREAEELVELFQKNYGLSYPFQEVYNPHFWNSRVDVDEDVEESLVSIVAVDDKRFVGHMALRKEPGSTRMEMLFPAVHPVYRKKVFNMSRLFWRCILESARRQEWKVIYHYSLLSYPISQVVSAKCFRSDTVALLPSTTLAGQYRSLGIKRQSGRASFLVMYNMLRDTTIFPKMLYTPAEHAGMIEELYQPLKLNRNFRKHSEPVLQYTQQLHGQSHGSDNHLENVQMGNGTYAVTIHPSPSLSKPRNNVLTPFSLRQDPVLNHTFLTIHPSDLSSFSQVAEQVEDFRKTQPNQLFVLIALDDPECPSLVGELETFGYRFSGILPEVCQRDYLVFSEYQPDELKGLALYSPGSKILRNYMVSFAPGRATRKIH